MKYFGYLIGMLWCSIGAYAQNNTISGFVFDKQSGEKLIGANVYNPMELSGTVTNKFGFFSLEIPKGKLDIAISYIGYETMYFKQDISRDTILRVGLSESYSIEEINVLAKANELQNPTSGIIHLSPKEIKSIPSLTGDAAIMKAYQLMPGVSQGKEGTNGMYVRGGSPDQNLLLLDDVPLYYVSHVGGFVSVFNESSISDIQLYKGGFPARYGGRLSSVMDIRMKDGNLYKTKGEIMLGLISSKILIEGPILKGKMSYSFSARKSMLDLVLKPITKKSMQGDGFTNYYFYDINAKINYILNANNRFFLSSYNGEDHIKSQMETKLDQGINSYDSSFVNYGYASLNENRWGNNMVCFRWNHVYNGKMFSNLTLATSNFRYKTKAETIKENIDLLKIAEQYETTFETGIKDVIGKIDFDYFPSNKHKVKMGLGVNYHVYNVGNVNYTYQIDTTALTDTIYRYYGFPKQMNTSNGTNNYNAIEYAGYIEDSYNITDKIAVNAGIHFGAYYPHDSLYISIQPRIVLNYNVKENLALKLSYSKMVQNMHMLTGNDANTPTDIWVPATKLAEPEKANQLSFSVLNEFPSWGSEVLVSTFYKNQANLIAYKNGESLTTGSKAWVDKTETGGKGEVYGIEFIFRKKIGKLQGWIGYTWSKNTRQFVGIDNNTPFPFKYDRRHDLSLVANYQINEKISLSASWVVQSGSRLTLGSARYNALVFYNQPEVEKSKDIVYFSETGRHSLIENNYDNAFTYGSRNNYQLPLYHRLDVSATFIKQKKRGIREWQFGFYNAYNQQNAYNVYYEIDQGNVTMYKFTLFPIIPSISYRFKF